MSERSRGIQRGFAVVGVILSMIFVGLEIRQNTKAVSGATIQGISDQSLNALLDMGGDADWIRVLTFIAEGGQLADLSPEDRMRHRYRAGATVRIMENRFRQTKLGILDESGLGVGSGANNANWYRSEHFIQYWRESDPPSEWDPEFVDFMETVVLAIR